MWGGYKNYNHYFQFNQYDQFIQEVSQLTCPAIKKSSRSPEYLNIPAAFDIETSSTYVNGDKFATMYIWQFGLNGSVIVGRTWIEFLSLLSKLSKHYNLDTDDRRLTVYVHNLSYEFQFIRKWIKWAKDKNGKDKVFAVKSRKVLYAIAENGIEFRCSYLLSNYNLAYIGDNLLKKYPVKKMVGDLDYNLLRHSKTSLTDTEISYCVNDVRVVMSYIEEKIEGEGGIAFIPLTNTGYVRNYCRDYCYGSYETDENERKKREFEYRAIMSSLKIKTEKEYRQLRQAFAGGFTHANKYWSGKNINNVGSIDLSSSYPSTMCADYYPMSSGRYIGEIKDQEKFYHLLDNYCCLFTCLFFGIYSISENEEYISVSKCSDISDNYVANNGRVFDADFLQITVTELDFDIISKVYSWENLQIIDMRVYDRGYLPRPLIMSILKLYEAKTALKGIEEKETEYMVSKNMINASYGMAVTTIVRDEILYSKGDWMTEDPNAKEQLRDYNDQYNRFLYYPWGVWVTAHARHNLWQAIFEFGRDYIYADTDSVKCINLENHLQWVKIYNMKQKSKLYKMCRYHKIDTSLIEPKTKKGVVKLLGAWDVEAGYKLFKTLGAKRYIYIYAEGDHKDELSLTVSGVNKRSAIPYLISKYAAESDDVVEKYLPVFNAFDDILEIPPDYSGKLTHTYIDNEKAYTLVDYQGNAGYCYEKSATHLEKAGYQFSISSQYLDFLKGFTQYEC